MNYVQITPTAATFINGQGIPQTIHSSSVNFNRVVELLKAGDFDLEELDKLINVRTYVNSLAPDLIQIVGNDVLLKGEKSNHLLIQRLEQALGDGGKYLDNLLAFARNYFLNPSFKARQQLWSFLEKGQNPLDDKGRFLAWKVVRADYKDYHTGKFDNQIGQILEMPREDVDDDPDRTCSAGLHVCTWQYIQAFGSNDKRVMLVAVDPKDVVSVPNDYDSAKMRVCRYEVIDEVEIERSSTIFENHPYYDSCHPDKKSELEDEEDEDSEESSHDHDWSY